jgi:hypothetical protein
MEECLALLRKADEMLMAENELAVAVHLMRVIEELEFKIDVTRVQGTQRNTPA